MKPSEHHQRILVMINDILEDRFGEGLAQFLLPPPVFIELGGEFISVDLDRGMLRTRFPIESRFLNPYGVLQGGMIAAAADNTLGPLSMLVAPPNLTRTLEIKYSKPVDVQDEFLDVQAELVEREGQRLYLSAELRIMGGKLIARARAMHWIIEP